MRAFLANFFAKCRNPGIFASYSARPRTGLGTFLGYSYNKSNGKVTARIDAVADAGPPAHAADARTGAAAAVRRRASARVGRRFCPRHIGGKRTGCRHAGLCGAFRSRRIRRGAGTGGTAGAGAPRLLCRHGSACRGAGGARATGNRHRHRLAGCGRGQSRDGGRRTAGLAARHKGRRNAAVAGVRRHGPHRLDDRRRAGLESTGHRARGGRLHRRAVRPAGGKLRPSFYARGGCLEGERLLGGGKNLSGAAAGRAGPAPRHRR